MAAGLFEEWRTGKNTQHTVIALFRQSVFSRLAGCEDTNDAEWLWDIENRLVRASKSRYDPGNRRRRSSAGRYMGNVG
ncbi:MAG: hypothetical protein IMZ44_11055 [Planctomycetes bacterium]|nr:hypothetical protein [Planctomycetota bacterium]